MALVLNEEQRMALDSAAGMLAAKAPVAALRRLRDAGNAEGFDRALWQEMAAMGWPAMAIAERHGGLGFGYVGLGQVLEQAGRHLVASPLLTSALAVAAALQLGGSEQQQAGYLPAIAAGELLATLAIDEGGRHQPSRVALAATREGDEFVLRGVKRMVPEAATADLFVVSARTSGEVSERQGISLLLVPADSAGVTVTATPRVDSRNAGTVTFDTVRVPAGALLGEIDAGDALLSRVLDVANIGLAAELLGVAREAFERTIAYLGERRQFGQPIGAFQALQHRAADMFCELEVCRSVVLAALQAADAGSAELPQLAAAAKAKLALVAKRVCCEAIQMFGGMGMTDEFDVGLFLKRAQALIQTWGDASYHLDRYAALKGY